VNALNNFDKIDAEYSISPTDDLIICWRSKVKVTAGHGGGEGIHVNTLGVEVHLLVGVFILTFNFTLPF